MELPKHVKHLSWIQTSHIMNYNQTLDFNLNSKAEFFVIKLFYSKINNIS